MPFEFPPGVLRNPDVNMGGLREEAGHLYSAYLLPTSLAKSEYALFQVNVNALGQGSASNALTYVETNMDNAGRLNDHTSWVIYDLGVGFNTSAVMSDVQAILDNSFLYFEKPGYNRYLGPLFMWGSGWGITGLTNVNARESISNGTASPRDCRRKLTPPIVLNRATTFKFSIFVGNAGYATKTLSATTWIWIDLWGIYRQSIPQ